MSKIKVKLYFSAEVEVDIEVSEYSDTEEEIVENLLILEKDDLFLKDKEICNIQINSYRWED